MLPLLVFVTSIAVQAKGIIENDQWTVKLSDNTIRISISTKSIVSLIHK
jgi:hypothetical protein